MLKDFIQEKNTSIYRLSKESGVPYATLSDIVRGKTKLERCSAETVYRISKVLGVSMETLIESCENRRCSFELYKSNVCHKVKQMGDIDFLIDVLESNEIRKLYEKRHYPEALYLLAMTDYLCRVNDIPLCREYSDIRQCCLSKPLYPAGIIAMDTVMPERKIKEQAVQKAIPEFRRFNIIESEVRDVV